MARVPTSSGLLEDKYTLETTFPKDDHRSHRPREWLVEGLQKVERLRFLCEEHGMTLAQAALKFILAQDAIACVLPTVTNEDDLEEWAAASDMPDLTADDLAPHRRALRAQLRRRAGAQLRPHVAQRPAQGR